VDYSISLVTWIKNFAKLIRAKDWIKNSFLFIPIFFSGELNNFEKLLKVVFAFIAFCLVSSAIYILNDYKDKEEDKLHPFKKYRPLAAGVINPTFALGLMVFMLLSGLIVGLLLPSWFILILITYALINVGYSLGLKKISIVDLIIVAMGFILRVMAGGVAANVAISRWLVIMVFLLSLFIVVTKRRDDILEFLKTGKVLRTTINHYNLDYVNTVISMLSGMIILAYMLYTISPEVVERLDSNYLYLTGIFVVAGLMRYLQIILVENSGGSPVNIIYTDRFIHITILLWLISFFTILYILKI
jgi:4-hydroxybenzoate polyprenyltransferase